MNLNKKIIIFTGPSLQPREAAKILKADYRPPVARGDIIKALDDDPDIIVIIDGVFHQQPAVSHKEILKAIKNDITVVGGASMGALRASELDDFGMIGVGKVYRAYRDGDVESDDDVAVTINPDNLEQLSEALISMNYNFKRALDNGIINNSEHKKLVETAKSTYYPKRTYKRIINDSNLQTEKMEELKIFFEKNAVNLKKQDALEVLQYVKGLK